MKRIVRNILLLVIAVCSINLILFTKEAKAYTTGALPLQVVDDINNTPYPNTTTIYYSYNMKRCSEFTIDSPGRVKAIFLSNSDIKSSGNSYAYISTDITGKDIVGNISNINGNKTEISWYLEGGTYYLISTWNAYPYELNAALLFEKSKVEKSNASTSFINSNEINFDDTVRGFLTLTKPNNYYKFELTKKAAVTVKYSFETSAAGNQALGYSTLYDDNELFLTEGTYKNSDKGSQEYTYFLEPGTYYIKLHGLLGNTTLNVTPMYYDINLSADSDNSWTKKTVNVNIDTSIDYSDIVVLCKDIKESLLNRNDVWSKTNTAYVALDGLTFIAQKSGIYSVRITDKYGNHTMQKIEISNIDITKPVIKGVTNNKAYRKPITITWSDKQSGINNSKTTLNGKAVSSGITVSKEGKYTLKVYDIIGNYRTVVFYIDNTAPTAGVEHGKVYKNSVTLKFKDNVSGLKKIMVDGEEVSTTFTTMYCYLDGEYTVEVWDNAGNYRKVVFTIKKN